MSSKNLKVIILVGLPASGKTSWSKEYLSKHSNTVHIGRDDFRYMLQNKGFCDNKVEELISSLMDNAIVSSLNSKLNVIIDNTNLKEKYINHFIDLCKYYADIEFMLFDVPAKVCIERDKLRERSVGESVINKMNNDFLKIRESSIVYSKISKIKNRPTKDINYLSVLDNAVIFDIDGTIALMSDKRGPFDWNKVDLDSNNIIVSELVKFHKDNNRKIILCSGRDEECRDITIKWLNDNSIYFDELYMRPNKDYRKDTIIKKEIYDNYIKDNYNVLCVYDDRLSVLNMWDKLGLFTFNVNQGNILF